MLALPLIRSRSDKNSIPISHCHSVLLSVTTQTCELQQKSSQTQNAFRKSIPIHTLVIYRLRPEAEILGGSLYLPHLFDFIEPVNLLRSRGQLLFYPKQIVNSV